MHEKIKLQERTTICQTCKKQSQITIVSNIQLALEKKKKKENNYFSNTWKKKTSKYCVSKQQFQVSIYCNTT